MTKEELLQPRYRVIANFPQQNSPIGHIYELKKMELAKMGTIEEMEKYFNQYPALFKKVEWWENREVKDLPQYLKCIETPDQKISVGQILKIKDYFGDDLGYCGRSEDVQENICVLNTNCYVPATEEEFENYLKVK